MPEIRALTPPHPKRIVESADSVGFLLPGIAPLSGKSLVVRCQLRFFPPRLSKVPADKPSAPETLHLTTRLCVWNLSPETTPEDLHSLFGQVSRVISIEIPGSRDSNDSQKFAFVEIDAVSIEDVILKLNITELDGRKLEVQESARFAAAEAGD